MAVDCHSEKPLTQTRYECAQGGFLRFSAGVGRGGAVSFDTSDVGDADGRGVVAAAMRTGSFEVSAQVYRAVEIYNVVIAYAVKAALAVPAVYISYGNVSAARGGGAVDDEAGDDAHGVEQGD